LVSIVRAYLRKSFQAITGLGIIHIPRAQRAGRKIAPREVTHTLALTAAALAEGKTASLHCSCNRTVQFALFVGTPPEDLRSRLKIEQSKFGYRDVRRGLYDRL
jgi:hypothetical protein